MGFSALSFFIHDGLRVPRVKVEAARLELGRHRMSLRLLSVAQSKSQGQPGFDRETDSIS